MIFDKKKIDHLRLCVKSKLSDKRYAHILGVEQMANWLGKIILPEKTDELRVAALLHDIAKEIPYEDQVSILRASDLLYTEEDLITKPALHSVTAVALIKDFYPEYATPDILSAVANHTLGRDGMSIFDEIIYISDYAEEGRTYYSCVKVREYLIDRISNDNSYDENLRALHISALLATDSTIESLRNRGEKINSRTFKTKAFLETLV